VAPHHKTNTLSKDVKPISFTLPADLQPLLKQHLLTGLAKVWEPWACTVEDEEDVSEGDMEQLPPTVFIWASTGKQIMPQQVSKVWTRVVLPPGFAFGPQRARAAFCTLVREDAVQAGLPFEEGAAAQVMGNSLQVWDMVYDRHHRQRQAQAAVDYLAEWRATMLAQHPQVLSSEEEEGLAGIVHNTPGTMMDADMSLDEQELSSHSTSECDEDEQFHSTKSSDDPEVIVISSSSCSE
jgi:hypothetical protein